MSLPLFVTILSAIVAVSHILQPQMWVTFFEKLLELQIAPVVIAAMHLPLGVALVLTHNDWSLQPGLIFTILGWGYCTKGTLYLLNPSLPGRVITPQKNFVGNMRIGGYLLCVLLIPMVLDVTQAR